MIWLALASLLAGIGLACKKHFTRYGCRSHDDYRSLYMPGDVTSDWLELLACKMFPNRSHGFKLSDGSESSLKKIMELLRKNEVTTRYGINHLCKKFLYERPLVSEDLSPDNSCEFALWRFLVRGFAQLKYTPRKTVVFLAAGQSGATTTSFVGVHFNKEITNYPKLVKENMRIRCISRKKPWLHMIVPSYCDSSRFLLYYP